MENPFSLKGKTTGQTPNNITIIKSIGISLVYVSRLKKNLSLSLSLFFALTHTNYLSQRWQHFAFSSIFSSPRTSLSLGYLLSLSGCSPFSLVWLPLFLFSIQYVAPSQNLINLFFIYKSSHRLLVAHES